MSSSLDSTYGFWLVAIWLQTLLQGCALLQAWLYFHWYSKDHWGIKTMVVILVVIETFQIVVFFQVTYFYLIDGFGKFAALFLIHWQDSAQLLATFLSAFIVQMYFGYCIFVLNRKNKIIPIIIVVLALTEIGSGIAQTINTVKLTSFTQLDGTKAVMTLQSAATLLCDAMITCSLVYTLRNHKGNFRSTDSILNTLMIYAINRGVLTAICAALNLILFLALPGTFYFFIGLELSGKLYVNSALATLNSRNHITRKSQSNCSLEWGAMQMDRLSDNTERSAANEDRHVRIIVTKQSENDSPADYKNSNFMEGML